MARSFEDVKEGDAIPPFVVENLTRTDLVKYAGNPTVFGHGMLTAGFVGRCITDFVGVENVRRYKVRFATRVWPGDTITCQGRVTKRYEADGEGRIDGEVAALNQKGEVAVAGTFTAALPRRG